MSNVNFLRDYGLFDAKVPRYTSYPPANRFQQGVGGRFQKDWLQAVPRAEPVSVYIHIPFCRRLCWFCACRTQGTKTLGPVDAYVKDLTREIALTVDHMMGWPKMARFHLGGGTPTLLSPQQMTVLLDIVEAHFGKTQDWEFSVEIDPTEAAPEILNLLAQRGMTRASIGVQDFAKDVQDAIGRQQSFARTKDVVDRLRASGVQSLNVDLLYGLPFQTRDSLRKTLDQVQSLRPDRLALYGYAHVPHMSKRQVMISDDVLPTTFARFEMAQMAKERLESIGYQAVGIDHFALPSDSLATAAQNGSLRRNFQGYTDDPCPTLIGFGASAISRFDQGYVQNAVATSAYQQRVRKKRLPGHKGYAMTAEDAFLADVVHEIMCHGCIPSFSLAARHPAFVRELTFILDDLRASFPEAFEIAEATLSFRPGMEALARVVAAHVDVSLRQDHVHSLAI